MTEEEARAAAYDLLARRGWSRKELEDRLRRRGASAAVARAVTERLVELGYLDDAEFARAWVEGRMRRRPAGPRRLEHELRRRGVDPSLAGESVSRIDPDVLQKQANGFAAERLRRLARAGEDLRSAARKVAAAMARRGFDWDVIRAALRNAGQDAEP